jgi:hypothetical protein
MSFLPKPHHRRRESNKGSQNDFLDQKLQIPFTLPLEPFHHFPFSTRKLCTAVQEGWSPTPFPSSHTPELSYNQ